VGRSRKENEKSLSSGKRGSVKKKRNGGLRPRKDKKKEEPTNHSAFIAKKRSVEDGRGGERNPPTEKSHASGRWGKTTHESSQRWGQHGSEMKSTKYQGEREEGLS